MGMWGWISLPFFPLIQLQGLHVQSSELQDTARLVRNAADKGAKSNSCLLFGRCQQGINSTAAGSETHFAIPNLLNTRDRTRAQLLPWATALFGAITELIPVFTSAVVPPWHTSGKCCAYCTADWSVGKVRSAQASAESPTGWTDIKNWRLWAQTQPRIQQHIVLGQVLVHIFFRSHYKGFINPAFGWNRALP